MGYSYLLSLEASLSSFRATYNVPNDVDIAYCHEGDIDLHRRIGSNTVFFLLWLSSRVGLGSLWTLSLILCITCAETSGPIIT